MKKLLLVLLLSVPAWAQHSVFQPTPASAASDPATCSTTGGWYQKFYYNTSASAWKFCSAANTWTAFADVTAASFATMTGCTTDGAGTLTCGLFLGTKQTATNDATKPVGNEAMKWVATNGWTLATTSDTTNPAMAIAYATAASSLVWPQAPGSQISAVYDGYSDGTGSSNSVVGHYALLSTHTNGQLEDSTGCPNGRFSFGTWADAGAAGTRTLNYNPRICPTEHVISWNVTATGDSKVYLPVYFACTIYAVDVTADQAGTFASDIDRHNAAIPNTTTDKISGTDGPALSGPAQINLAHTPSGWGSTALASGDVLDLNVTTFTTVTNVHVQLRCR